MWLFASSLYKQYLLWLHRFIFTFAAFAPLILRSSEKEKNILKFRGGMTFAFLGWQPGLSLGLFPLGYFLLISFPLSGFFPT